MGHIHVYEMNEQILDNLVIGWYFFFVRKWFAKKSVAYLPQFQNEIFTEVQVRTYYSSSSLDQCEIAYNSWSSFRMENLHK